jgi:hypothetical protein
MKNRLLQELQAEVEAQAGIDGNGQPLKAPAPELPPIESAAALLADDTIILPPLVIEDVLHQSLKGVLGSNSKARKTWILLDVATSVATGTPFWKWETRKGKVLYINFEIPRAFIRSRVKRLCEHKGIRDISNLDIWTLRGHAAALGKLLPSLLAKIKTGDYTLVVIDPVYKTLGGRDENAAGDIGELCNELEQIAVETGAAVLFAAHFSKGNQSGKEAIDRIGGSGVWTRDADSIITLTKHTVEDAYTVDLILRNLPEHPPFCVKWSFPVMALAPDLDPEDLKQPGGRRQQHGENDLLAILPPAGLTTTKWQLKAEKECGISRRTFFRLKSALEKAGRVLLSRVSDKWKSVKKQ